MGMVELVPDHTSQIIHQADYASSTFASTLITRPTLSSLSSRNKSLILSPSTDFEDSVADTHPSFSSVNQALVPTVNTSKDCCAVAAAMVDSS